MNILALSGSLRMASSNNALLHALHEVAPQGTVILISDLIGQLPHFNPDIDDSGQTPAAVQEFRAQMNEADGVIFSTPEYAHGVPGVLKNALDWLVGSGELVDKPVALFNASPRGTHAIASLTEILTVMSAHVVDEASVTLPLPGRTLPEGGIAADAELADMLQAGITSLRKAILS
ncbi:MAG: hypothetical protein GC184_07465 [Rhizobiales bacterium]|nr:hypothetical protein [Hyphomicrobiales bacterium]